MKKIRANPFNVFFKQSGINMICLLLLIYLFSFYGKNISMDLIKIIESIMLAEKNSISFLFLGDIMCHDLQIESAYDSKTKKYDFSSQFDDIKPFIADVDLTIANLEFTLSGPPYQGYPKFSSPDQLAIDIKNAGIDYLVTANNHISDWGEKGFNRTVDLLDSLGFKHTGSFRNRADKEKRHPLVIDEKDWKIALFNYTYGINKGIYGSELIINIIDTNLIKKDLMKAKKKGYDAIIVYFHWGQEYKRNANKKQRRIAQICFENGANVVIGAHPHVLQEMEKYTFTTSKGQQKDVLVFYSLGNYVANCGNIRYINGGALARFTLRKTETKEIKIEEQGCYLVWIYRKPKTWKLKTYYILPIDLFEGETTLVAKQKKVMDIFVKDSREYLKKFNKNVNEYRYDKNKKRWVVDWN